MYGGLHEPCNCLTLSLLYLLNTTYHYVTFILEVGNWRQFLYSYKVLGTNKKKAGFLCRLERGGY